MGRCRNKPIISVVADAIRDSLKEEFREFPEVSVRRSWRADQDVSDSDESGTIVTIMPEYSHFDATLSRDELEQNSTYIVGVSKNLDPEKVTGRALGEGWNEEIDKPAAVMERILEIFSGGRIITVADIGDIDVTLVKSETDRETSYCDLDELIENSRYLGIVNIHTRWRVPRDPMRPKGSA